MNNRNVNDQKFISLVLINGSEQMIIVKSMDIQRMIENLSADIKNVIDTADDAEKLHYQTQYDSLVMMRKSIGVIASCLEYMSRTAESHAKGSGEVFESLIDQRDELSKDILRTYSVTADKLFGHDGQLWASFDDIERAVKTLTDLSGSVFESSLVNPRVIDVQSDDTLKEDDHRVLSRRARLMAINEAMHSSIFMNLTVMRMAMSLGTYGARELSQYVATSQTRYAFTDSNGGN